MATSGSTNFVITRDEIITDAYSHLGHLDEGETLNSERLSYGARQLNKMLKAWAIKGLHLWTIYENALPLVDGKSSYTAGPTGDLVMQRPLRILSARRRVGSIDTPIWVTSREEYFSLPNKTTEAPATQIYYDPQLVNGVIYVWPTPDNSTDTIRFDYEGLIQDFDTASDDTPLPSEWSEALSWNLATRLAGRENVDLNTWGFVKGMADEMLTLVEWHDNEHAPLEFVFSDM